MKHKLIRILAAFVVLFSLAAQSFAQVNLTSFSGKRQKRIVIRNATAVDGSGKPAAGPFDIVIENGLIAQIVAIDPVSAQRGEARRPAQGDLEIDATGKYVLPGLI